MMEELDLPPRTDDEDFVADDISQDQSDSDSDDEWSMWEDDPYDELALDLYWNACNRAEQQCSGLPRYGLTAECIDYLLRAYPVFRASERSVYKMDWLSALFDLFATKEEKSKLSAEVWDSLFDLSLEPPELEFLDTWAEDVLRSIYDQSVGTSKIDKWNCYVALKKYGVDSGKFDQNPPYPAHGLKIAITGTIPNFTRTQLTDVIRASGCEVLSTVSPKCDGLVVGNNPGSKLAVARKLGIRCMTIEDLLTMLGAEP